MNIQSPSCLKRETVTRATVATMFEIKFQFRGVLCVRGGKKNPRENGNVFFFVLLAIVLIGLVTAALRQGSNDASIDNENLTVKTSQVRQYAAELERGVSFVLQNGLSEVDIRFAHPDASSDYGSIATDPTHQVFDKTGGGVEYRAAPSGINDGSPWEFYGASALPQVGSDSAELIAVLPNVTAEFCSKINAQVGYTAQPTDTGAGATNCVNGGATLRFDAGTQFSGVPNTVNAATFSVKPSVEGCVSCVADGAYHYYRVLMAR